MINQSINCLDSTWIWYTEGAEWLLEVVVCKIARKVLCEERDNAVRIDATDAVEV